MKSFKKFKKVSIRTLLLFLYAQNIQGIKFHSDANSVIYVSAKSAHLIIKIIKNKLSILMKMKLFKFLKILKFKSNAML